MRRLDYTLLGIALLGFLLSSATTQAGDKTLKAHPHPAMLKPITSSPKGIQLNDAELKSLENGESVLRQTKGEDGGVGVAIQLIHALPSHIWDTVLNYDRYKEWVDNVDSCRVYKNDQGKLYVDMRTSVLWLDNAVFTINTIRKDQGYMSWVLDRTHTSDVQDMVGYWRIESLSENPPLSKLEHSTELIISGVPDFLISYLMEDSLTEGTAWVKREAEKLAKKKSKVSKR